MEKIQDLKCPHGNSGRSGDKIEPDMKKMVDGQISQSYGLRENPKKTMRGVDQHFPLPQDRVCKQCGKVFQSMKALCGHMASHSEKKLVIESDSDAESEERKRRKKAKGKKYNKIAKSNSYCFANGSSSVSEIDEKDEEEMVICLMLLSRDYASCRVDDVNSIGESSDNNSGVLETKSKSNEDEVLDLDKTGDKKLNYSSGLDAEDSDSDSGYFLDDVSMSDTEKKKELVQEYGTESKTKTKEFLDDEDELVVESYKRIKYGSSYAEVLNTQQQKRSKYECFDCKRSFKSYQALGGHRPCLKRNNANDATDQEPMCLGNKKVKSKKQKGYACPFCERVFKSGQALGGHKRSHFLGANASFTNQSPETNPVVHDLFDLNLPAPQDEDENSMI